MDTLVHNPSSVLLVTHVPLLKRGGVLMIDDQTGDGLARWAENFDRITYTGIIMGEGSAEPAPLAENSVTWTPVSGLRSAERMTFLALPRAYRLRNFAASYRPVRAMLAEQIRQHRYLCFTLGALAGDWGAVAGLEAIAQRRDYAVWFDRVEHEVIRNTVVNEGLKRRLKARVEVPLMARYHRHLINHSSLGLFQGQDTYQTYAGSARRAFCVYDTHTQKEDRIEPADLQAKIDSLMTGRPLQIVYAGRAADMKGPLEWLQALGLARQAGLRFNATWLGDGPLLAAMKDEVERLNLSGCVTLPGFVGERDVLLSALRQADLFLFCHKTPESPRCLVESLVSGTPLVGFRSPYAVELSAQNHSGRFARMGDSAGLAGLLLGFDADREQLATMIRGAALDGQRFDEETVYRQRGDLLKANL